MSKYFYDKVEKYLWKWDGVLSNDEFSTRRMKHIYEDYLDRLFPDVIIMNEIFTEHRIKECFNARKLRTL